MSSSDGTTAIERGGARVLAAEPVTRIAEPVASQHVEAAPSVGLASPTSILIGSLAFGIMFLLAWQFLPPALGVPSFIIPTVTDLVREIRYRLEDSLDAILEREDKRGFREIREDMEICWARFSTRFLRMELAEELADAVMKGEDADRIKRVARLIIEHRAAEVRMSRSES